MRKHIIRTAIRTDALSLRKLLIEVFSNDPLMRWFLKKEPGHAKAADIFFRYMVDSYCLPYGTALVAGQIDGAALWMPPNRWQLPLVKELISIPLIIRAFGVKDLSKKLKVRKTVDGIHPGQPHYYLAALGVKETLRGCGLGSALIKPVLEKSDNEKAGCYLETSRESNLKFYEYHGFTVTAELSFGEENHPLWCMWREPQ